VTLQPEQMLAHYRLVEKIGEGGMGVVWKAEDTKLSRDVAVKILPEEFAKDQQRLARFEREAKLLATLNHPNVAAIYGFDNAEGVHFLVLELVNGQTLAQMTKTGPVPVEEALDICRQVAEGLEAAHEAGVIHRDLKPGNVIVTEDGKAKVLDFGLAKGLEGTAGGESGSDLSMSPTETFGGTQAGVVMGTAPYMSPEQARGKKLDKRTDIFSFGCLLFECLTGKLVFTGETVTDTLSAILQNDPDWSALPDKTPRRIRELLERCLEKNPRNRLHDIGDARIDLDKSFSAKEWTTSGIRAVETAARAGQLSRRGIAVGAVTILAAGILVGAGASALWNPASVGNAPSPVRHLAIVPPPELRLPAGNNFVVLPHGNAIGLAAAERDDPESGGAMSYYHRWLDVNTVRRVEGSEGAIGGAYSPDGRWIAMVTPISHGSTTYQVVKAPVDGSAPPVRIADWPEDAENRGILWLPSGEIAILTGLPPGDRPSLHRVPVDGTPPSAPVEIDLQGYRFLTLFQALPGGRHLLLGGNIFGEWGDRKDALLLDMETGTLRLLLEDANPVLWSPTGHLLLGRGDALLAVPFDVVRLVITGGPVAILSGIESRFGRYNSFTLSDDGTLVYPPATGGLSHRRLAFVNRDGTTEAWSEERRAFRSAEISPDGQQLATQVVNPDRYLDEIWISDVDQPRLRRLAAEPGMDCANPVWSPDSKRVAYDCWGGGDEGGIYVRQADGTGEPEQIIERGSQQVLRVAGFSSDGSSILVNRRAGGPQGIHLLPLQPDAGGSRKLTPVTLEPSASFGRASYDGRWLSYQSDETGRMEIYLRSLAADGTVGRRFQISTNGGFDPSFVAGPDQDPLEIYYVDGRLLMMVSIATEPAMKISEPRTVQDLERLQERARSHLPGGRHLIVQGIDSEGETRQINVVLNFHEEIRRKFAEAE
jgi:hypothetical protein